MDLKSYHRYRHVSKKYLKYGTKKGSGPVCCNLWFFI